MSKRLQSLIDHAKQLLEESYDVIEPIEYEPAQEVQVFDFDQTLHHEYNPLQCCNIMAEKTKAGIPCYIVTARSGDGQAEHIQEVMLEWGISIPLDNIKVVGEQEKGPFVADVIRKHDAESFCYWDDMESNCENVYRWCAPEVEQLQIYWLSRAILGDIRKEIRKDAENERIDIYHTIQERKIFRNWRRLSKI